MKTPLTVVRGNVDLLLEGELSGEQRACAADVAEGARQMGTYVSALIDASLGVGASFAPKEARLRPLLERLRAQVEALAAASGVRVAWSEGADLPAMMLLDEALVERAVANVAANAVEHAPAGSSVAVDVQAGRRRQLCGSAERGRRSGLLVGGFAPRLRALLPGRCRTRGALSPSGLRLHVAAETSRAPWLSVEWPTAAPPRRRRAGDIAVAAGYATPQEPAGSGLRGVGPSLLKRYRDSTASSGFLAGSASGWKGEKLSNSERSPAFREGQPRSVGKPLLSRRYGEEVFRRLISAGFEFDSFRHRVRCRMLGAPALG